MADPTRITLATATGPVLVVLMLHFGAGLVGLLSGGVAVAAHKGSVLHRRSGTAFVIAMIALGITAVGMALVGGRMGNLFAGAMTVYFVVTAVTTFRPIGGSHRSGWAAALALIALTVGCIDLYYGVIALGRPRMMLGGVPGPMILFMGTVSLLAFVGDVRLLRTGDIGGSRRVARHLWRMCFALFIASGSFFLGQMKFLPESLRITPLLMFLGVGPLLLLLYWMWRVRLRNKLHGLELRPPIIA